MAPIRRTESVSATISLTVHLRRTLNNLSRSIHLAFILTIPAFRVSVDEAEEAKDDYGLEDEDAIVEEEEGSGDDLDEHIEEYTSLLYAKTNFLQQRLQRHPRIG